MATATEPTKPTRPTRPIDYSQVPTYIAHENLSGELVEYPTPAEESSGTDSWWGESTPPEPEEPDEPIDPDDPKDPVTPPDET